VERDEDERRRFVGQLEALLAGARPVRFIDESGFDERLCRPRARARRGEAVYAHMPGRRGARTSIISSCHGNRLESPMVFEGYCNRDVVEAWLSEMLLPTLPKGCVIVLDNASFQRSPSTRALVEAAGCFLMFLPAYSPDLNPIEHVWANLKKQLQGGLSKAKDKNSFIYETCLALSG
jgi:transposase